MRESRFPGAATGTRSTGGGSLVHPTADTITHPNPSILVVNVRTIDLLLRGRDKPTRECRTLIGRRRIAL
jgi:hypothetical protein